MTHRENTYFMVSRAAVNDSRLSFMALGILTFLLSKPNTWVISLTNLSQYHTDDAPEIALALDELTEYGYLMKEGNK